MLPIYEALMEFDPAPRILVGGNNLSLTLTYSGISLLRKETGVDYSISMHKTLILPHESIRALFGLCSN